MLVYASHDESHNDAVVLRSLLLGRQAARKRTRVLRHARAKNSHPSLRLLLDSGVRHTGRQDRSVLSAHLPSDWSLQCQRR
jgi:hypothetical protein